MDKMFYVYILCDPRKPGTYKYGEKVFFHEPFYVGKGKGTRCYDHFRDRNKDKLFKSNKIIKIYKETGKKPIIYMPFKNISEQEAFDKEIELINLIGRYDLKLGPLTNLTDGGEGNSNRSEETKKKISNSTKGKTFSKETRKKISESKKGDKNPNFNKHLSKETKQKISKKLKNKEVKKETREKISIIHKGKVLSKETKNKISISRKNKCCGSDNHFYGKHHSEETKEKMRESWVRRKQNG